MISTYEGTSPPNAVLPKPTHFWMVAAFVAGLFGLYDWYASPMVNLLGRYDWDISPALPILNGILMSTLALVALHQRRQGGRRGRAPVQFARAFAILWTAVHVALLFPGH